MKTLTRKALQPFSRPKSSRLVIHYPLNTNVRAIVGESDIALHTPRITRDLAAWFIDECEIDQHPVLRSVTWLTVGAPTPVGYEAFSEFTCCRSHSEFYARLRRSPFTYGPQAFVLKLAHSLAPIDSSAPLINLSTLERKLDDLTRLFPTATVVERFAQRVRVGLIDLRTALFEHAGQLSNSGLALL